MGHLKSGLKVLVTLALLYWVFRQADLEEIKNSLADVNFLWLSAAFLVYQISRVASAFRVATILRCFNVILTATSLLRLQWTSMFYGIFLPGGLGGDAYKLIVLRRRFPFATIKSISTALLWDRISGFCILGMLIALFALPLLPDMWWILVALTVAFGAATGWLAVLRWVPVLKPVLYKMIGFSLVIQLTQVACVCFLLFSIGVDNDYPIYLLLFLLSSIASALPVTVGGIGIREFVLMKGGDLLAFSQPSLVTIGILFDLIVTITALTGGITAVVDKEDTMPPNRQKN